MAAHAVELNYDDARTIVGDYNRQGAAGLRNHRKG